eukprot:SAG11_NODE_1055_length_6017_cov_1.548496_8_plen_98_part_00
MLFAPVQLGYHAPDRWAAGSIEIAGMRRAVSATMDSTIETLRAETKREVEWYRQTVVRELADWMDPCGEIIPDMEEHRITPVCVCGGTNSPASRAFV